MGIDSLADVGKLASLDPTLLKDLSPEFIARLSDLIFVIKAAGILFIVYAIILIIGGVMGFLRNRRIKKIYEKIKNIDEKLDKLLKEKISEEKDKKESKKEDKKK
jgi:sulfite exporter TauE/SafE